MIRTETGKHYYFVAGCCLTDVLTAVICPLL